ncbi:MAG TPA: hypothetical protein PK690_09040 [Emcibacteraceae bacterium]|nr:hypothetical protein [Emcibacteraceae bacterium]
MTTTKKIEWEVQKVCTDIGDYELTIEKQKTEWACEQNFESWRWAASYHGSIVSSGSENSLEEAKHKAVMNTPGNDG